MRTLSAKSIEIEETEAPVAESSGREAWGEVFVCETLWLSASAAAQKIYEQG